LACENYFSARASIYSIYPLTSENCACLHEGITKPQLQLEAAGTTPFDFASSYSSIPLTSIFKKGESEEREEVAPMHRSGRDIYTVQSGKFVNM